MKKIFMLILLSILAFQWHGLYANASLTFVSGPRSNNIELIVDPNTTIVVNEQSPYRVMLQEGQSTIFNFQDENKQPLTFQAGLHNNLLFIELVDPSTSELLLMQSISSPVSESNEITIPLDLEIVERNGNAQAQPTNYMLTTITQLSRNS